MIAVFVDGLSKQQLFFIVLCKCTLYLGGKKKDEGPDYSKYDGMKKMGLPIHVITNKMKLDGLKEEDIEKWKNRMWCILFFVFFLLLVVSYCL